MRSWFFLLGMALVLGLFVVLLRVPPGVAAADVAAVTVDSGVTGASEEAGGDAEALASSALNLGVSTEAGLVELSTPATAREVGDEDLGRISLIFVDAPRTSLKQSRGVGRVTLERVGLGMVDVELLRDKGTVTFEGLAAGTYTVTAGERAPFRFEALSVNLAEGEWAEREVRAEFMRPVEFKITATQAPVDPTEANRSRSTASCEIHAIAREDQGRGRLGGKSARTLRMGEEVSVVLDVFSGPFAWEGSFRGRRGRPVVPAMIARAEVMVPYPVPGESDLILSGSALVSVDVSLEFGDRSQTVSIMGVILNDRSERAGGVKVTGSSVSGEAFAEVLTVREDGGFFLSAELDQLSGPQVYLRSAVHKDVLGPFVLVLGQNHLGELRFKSRLTQAEVTRRKDLILDLAKLPPSARGQGKRAWTDHWRK